MFFAGIDAGSVSVKLAVLNEKGEKVWGGFLRHRGHPLKAALELLKAKGPGNINFGETSFAITGSAGRLLASVFGLAPLNEAVAQATSTRKLFPDINNIIELGGEDSKLIILGENGIEDFSMNSVCAAGTGSFLDQQAERLKLSIEEFSEMALKSANPARIAGRCSVFAKSDMIHLQQIATPVEDIVSGLCFAVARNFKGAIMRGRTLKGRVSFQGGVAANNGMARAFKETLGLDDLFIPPDFVLMGAIGAALKAMESPQETNSRIDPALLEKYLERGQSSRGGHKPLLAEGDRFRDRHMKAHSAVRSMDGEKSSSSIRAWLGVDIGSISTNVVLLDDNGRLLAKRYLMTAGRPLEAVRQGLREIYDELGGNIQVAGVGTTGSGRYMIADYIGADVVKNEITAQATAAAFIDPEVDTIFEIGGQDSKYISLKDGVIVDFEMNKACAAGTGSFLEEQAEKLDISIKGEFADLAFSCQSPLRLGERCTVFMENSLMAGLGKGAKRQDVLAGLAYSIVQNYINRVVAGKPIGKKIFFQGGVAFNKSVVAAFEKYLGVEITVPPNHDVTGAIGMALLAKENATGNPLPEGAGMATKSAFKGFREIEASSYNVSSFKCQGCSNICEINRVNVEGEKTPLYYGGRCEKYDIKRKPAGIRNYFRLREELLWKHQLSMKPLSGRPVIGIPYIFFFEDQLPFWGALFHECGFNLAVSPKTTREIASLGLESVLSEACFPVKVAHGHIRYLMEKGVDSVFVPSFINLNTADEEYPSGQACPMTQTIPYVAKAALKGLKSFSPPVSMSMDNRSLAKTLRPHLEALGGIRNLSRAIGRARAIQAEFLASIKEEGAKFLTDISSGNGSEKAVVILGRAYNAYDKGMNLEIPEKLATLGVRSIPMDFLPLKDVQIRQDYPQMYWRSGQQILKAARFICNHPNLYPIFLGNFSCGPDSFLLKHLKKEFSSAGKPVLHIEIDEHSADAGAITRCEAFLDSIGKMAPVIKAEESVSKKIENKTMRARAAVKKRTVYIPLMSDHAFALKAGFEHCGVPAEVLPPSDARTVALGERHVSGKECYPFMVTAGDMLKQVHAPGFKPGESAFFMPSGTGPCRFGQYHVFHKQILEDMGIPDVPIFAPNQDQGFYGELGMVGKDFTLTAWKGIVAIELLIKNLHETRPYESQPGRAEEAYIRFLPRICEAVKGANGIRTVLGEMKEEFAGIPKTNTGKKPLVGVVGEIFVRSNRFSNEGLVKKIEALGGEVWLAPVEEWIYYVNLMSLRKGLARKDWKPLLETALKRFLQERIEHKYHKTFAGCLKTLHEPSTRKILGSAAPYVHDSFEGETVLSIGKAVDLARRGAAGIVNAMPFGCMPGTIVTALLRSISRDYGIPAISMPFDGTESLSNTLQLEAFMDQAKQRGSAIVTQ